MLVSSLFSKGKDLKPYPDYGFYLDIQWARYFGMLTNNGEGKNPVPYPATVFHWPDMQAINPAELDHIVRFVRRKLRKGKVVDIACIGGHGRTGTLLAAIIGKEEKLSGKEAIAAVRGRYCRKAIETKGQEILVEHYLDEYGR